MRSSSGRAAFINAAVKASLPSFFASGTQRARDQLLSGSSAASTLRTRLRWRGRANLLVSLVAHLEDAAARAPAADGDEQIAVRADRHVRRSKPDVAGRLHEDFHLALVGRAVAFQRKEV